MRQAVVLVGGRGTRLGELARETPKPLMPIAGDRRFLDYLLHNVARHGFTDILLIAGHLGEQVSARYQGQIICGATIDVVREPAPAGTAGALKFSADRLDEVFLLLNGDSIFDVNYLALEAALTARDTACIALREVPDGARYGRVTFDDGRVTGFHEKDPSFPGKAVINGGVYALRRSVLDLIVRTPMSLETDVLPELCAQGRVAGALFDRYFLDIGLPETLDQARAELPARMRRPAVFFDRDGTLNRDDGYTYRIDDLEFLPGAIESVRACNDAGALAIVVTNQSGIARGKYCTADMHAFHERMQQELRVHGAHVDHFYHCPFHDEAVEPAYMRPNHPDRKPNPGLLRRAILEWQIDPTRTLMVGDHQRDVEAAERLGVSGMQVRDGELLVTVQEHLNSLGPPRQDESHLAALQDRAGRAKHFLFEHALPLWWERGFDRDADCFHERLALNGEPVRLNRRIRVQARQTFVYAMAGQLGWPGPWREAVEAGVRVLTTRGLTPDGGVAHLLDDTGATVDRRHDLYDTSFVIFALAHASKVLERPDLSVQATQLVDWVKTHWAHPAGGYREGELVTAAPRRQNPHMHFLEALLALHEASGAQRHLDDALAITQLFEKKFVSAEWGALLEYFEEDWRPASGREGFVTEPGHQFEWAWLMDRVYNATRHDARATARRIQIHGEVYGVDPVSGFICDEVWAEGDVKTATGRFWPSTERLKANIVYFESTGDAAAAEAAVQAFDVIMEYCNAPTSGLWRDRRLPDRSFIEEAAPASSFYHAILSMSELIRVAHDLSTR